MKRTDYLKPTMKVVQLKHQSHILAGSGPVPQAEEGAKIEDYEEDNTFTW